MKEHTQMRNHLAAQYATRNLAKEDICKVMKRLI